MQFRNIAARGSRFRVNVFMQQQNLGIVVRRDRPSLPRDAAFQQRQSELMGLSNNLRAIRSPRADPAGTAQTRPVTGIKAPVTPLA